MWDHRGSDCWWIFGFGFITGPCEQERLKVQYTAHRTFSMADSLTVGLTLRWDFSSCCWEMKGMPSICCLHDLDTFPGFFFSPEVIGYQQIVGYQILPFWLIFRHIYSQSLSFPNSCWWMLDLGWIESGLETPNSKTRGRFSKTQRTRDSKKRLKSLSPRG